MPQYARGKFIGTKTKADAEFYGKAFGEVAGDLEGLTFKMSLSCDGAKRWFYSYTCDERPEFNDSGVYLEGVWQEVNSPLLGGKAKLKFKQDDTGNGFHTDVDSPTLGKWTFDEVYNEDGVKVTTTKDGVAHTECLKRVVDIYGSYRYDRDENAEAYMRKQSMPEDFIGTLKDFAMKWTMNSDGSYTLVEFFGDLKVTHRYNLDEEIDYKFPVEGIPASKYIVSKLGPYKYTSVVKYADGRTEKWDFIYTCGGLELIGKNMKTGDSCKIFMKKYVDFAGTWRPVVSTGMVEAIKSIGGPADLAHKIENEFDARLVIKQRGPLIDYQLKSKYIPLAMAYELDKEFETYHPLLKEDVKMVVTANGNKISGAMKSSKVSAKFVTTVGDTFMVSESCVEGSDITTKVIMERVN